MPETLSGQLLANYPAGPGRKRGRWGTWPDGYLRSERLCLDGNCNAIYRSDDPIGRRWKTEASRISSFQEMVDSLFMLPSGERTMGRATWHQLSPSPHRARATWISLINWMERGSCIMILPAKIYWPYSCIKTYTQSQDSRWGWVSVFGLNRRPRALPWLPILVYKYNTRVCFSWYYYLIFSHFVDNFIYNTICRNGSSQYRLYRASQLLRSHHPKLDPRTGLERLGIEGPVPTGFHTLFWWLASHRRTW